MKKLNITLLTAFAAAAAFASSAQAAVTLSDGHTGDYRIIFVTLGMHGAKDIPIGPYNTFVTTEAGLAASTETVGFATDWTAVGSTTGTSARVNTSTTGAGTDIHIYTPSGTAGEYTLVAESYDDLWDGSILAGIRYGDGSPGDESIGGRNQSWTGTKANGDPDDYSGDASGPLGTSEGGSNTGPNRNIALAVGGRTNNGWIKAANDHDGEGDGGSTYMRHFMGLSGVIGSVPAAPFAITEIDYDPDADTVTLTWRSRPNTTYGAFSSFDLSDWSNELADSLGINEDENPNDGNHITVTFPLSDGLEDATDLFLRIQEE